MSSHTRVCIIGDRHIIETDSRRAEAILLTLSGASMADVGRRFGISRERIRQYMKDAGLTGKARKIVRPLSQWATKWIGMPERQRQGKAQRRQRSRVRILHAIEIVKAFAQEHGRAPVHLELAQLLGLPIDAGNAAPLLISYFKRGGDVRTAIYIRRLDFVYRAAGFPGTRPRGTNAHRDGGKSNLAARKAGVKRWWANMPADEKAARIAKLRAGQSRESA